eukprot:RCo038362
MASGAGTRLAPLPAVGSSTAAAARSQMQSGLMGSGSPTYPASMLSATVPSLNQSSASVEKLKLVKTALVGLPAELRQDVDARRATDEQRLLEVRELAIKVERHLALEVKRRSDADKALQLTVEQRMAEIAANVERVSMERAAKLQASLDVLTKTLGDLRVEFQEERQRTARLAAELRHAAEHSVSDLRSALEQEKVSRLEKEAQIQVKLAQDILKSQERDELERTQREAAVEHTREEFAKMMKDREKLDSQFRAKVVDDIACLKAAVEAEAENRVSSEEHITHTLDSVVSQLHASLKVVSQN